MVSAGQMWFSWVSQGIQGLSQGSVKMPIKMSYGSPLKAQLGRGLLSSLLTWLLPRLSSSQAVGWIKASVPCWLLVPSLVLSGQAGHRNGVAPTILSLESDAPRTHNCMSGGDQRTCLWALGRTPLTKQAGLGWFCETCTE